MTSAVAISSPVPPVQLWTVQEKSGSYDCRVDVDTARKPGQPTGVIPMIDVYLLADNTGSMGDVIANVSKKSSEIITALKEKAGAGADLYLGVGSYEDFGKQKSDPPVFNQRLPLTESQSSAGTKKIIDAVALWNAGDGGSSVAEAQLYALDSVAEAPGGKIGWRDGAKRIVLWFGDAPGHDPICKAVTGLDHDITEQSVIGALKKQGIMVVAISVFTSSNNGPGLNVNPKDCSERSDAYKACGDFSSGGDQAKHIAEATKGYWADGINKDQIVDQIIKLGEAAVGKVSTVGWRVAGNNDLSGFITGPSSGEVSLREGNTTRTTGSFTITLTGVTTGKGRVNPPKTAPLSLTGKVFLSADSTTPAEQVIIKITVPDLAGKYRIQSVIGGGFLQPMGNRWGNDAIGLEVAGEKPGGSQQWELMATPGGGYSINNLGPHSGKYQGGSRYLEVPGAKARETDESGGAINILGRGKERGATGAKTAKDNTNLQWQMVPVGADDDGIIYRIETVLRDPASPNQRYVIDSTSPGGKSTVKLSRYTANYPSWKKASGQHWRLLPQ